MRVLKTFAISYFSQHFHLCWRIELHESLYQSQDYGWAFQPKVRFIFMIKSRDFHDATSRFHLFFLVLLKKMRTLGQSELGRRLSARFPWIIPVLESFSCDLLPAIVSFRAESYLESCWKYTREIFWESSQRSQDSDYFDKKTLPQMFDKVLNNPPSGKVL